MGPDPRIAPYRRVVSASRRAKQAISPPWLMMVNLPDRGGSMRFRVRTSRAQASALVLLAAALLPACVTWKTDNVAPVQTLNEPSPRRLRVTLTDGSQVVLTSPRIKNDSLVGNAPAVKRQVNFSSGTDVPGRPAGRMAIALPLVASTEAQRTHVGRSIATGTGVGVLIFGVVVMAAFSGGCGSC